MHVLLQQRDELRVQREGLVEIGFRAANDQGDHVSGTAVVGLPIAKGVA